VHKTVRPDRHLDAAAGKIAPNNSGRLRAQQGRQQDMGSFKTAAPSTDPPPAEKPAG